MTSFGFIETTQKLNAASDSDSFTVNGPEEARRSFALSSDVAVHIARNADATTSDARVPAETIVKVTLFGGDTLSVCKAEGAGDGSCWVTLTDN